jgi:hypothetical protein
MRFQLRQEFHYPIRTVIAARELRFDDDANRPGLESHELLGVERDGPIIITRRLLKFGGGIPEIVRKLVPSDMLEMIDTNYFNTETYLSRFIMHSEHFPDKVKISATCPYIAISDITTVREYEVHVHVSVPLVGNTVAKAIAQSHREALIQDHQIMLRACERLARQQAG